MGDHISQKWYEFTTGDREIDRYGRVYRLVIENVDRWDWDYRLLIENKYLLLTEFERRTVGYGPSFFLLEGEKTRIRNLQYGPRKRG